MPPVISVNGEPAREATPDEEETYRRAQAGHASAALAGTGALRQRRKLRRELERDPQAAITSFLREQTR